EEGAEVPCREQDGGIGSDSDPWRGNQDLDIRVGIEHRLYFDSYQGGLGFDLLDLAGHPRDHEFHGGYPGIMTDCSARASKRGSNNTEGSLRDGFSPSVSSQTSQRLAARQARDTGSITPTRSGTSKWYR